MNARITGDGGEFLSADKNRLFRISIPGGKDEQNVSVGCMFLSTMKPEQVFLMVSEDTA